MNKEDRLKLLEEWYEFVETLPSRVGETPKAIVAHFWLEKIESIIKKYEND